MVRLLIVFLILNLLVLPASALKEKLPRVFHAAFGTGEVQVGGAHQDPHGISEGFPAAFAELSDGRILILDTVNTRVIRYAPAADTREILCDWSTPGQIPDAVYDIAPSVEGGFWLASRGRKEVRRIGQTGSVEVIIEGVFPQAICQSGNHLLIAELKRSSVMRFTLAGRMDGLLEAGALPPVSFTGEELYTAEFEKPSGNIYRCSFSGTREVLCEVTPPDKDQYMQSLTPLGCDRAGLLYVEAVFGRDLDESHTNHQYLLQILKIDPRSGKILARRFVEPFRNRNSLLAPRQYSVSPGGSLLTYEIEEGGFSLYRVEFAAPPESHEGK